MKSSDTWKTLRKHEDKRKLRDIKIPVTAPTDLLALVDVITEAYTSPEATAPYHDPECSPLFDIKTNLTKMNMDKAMDITKELLNQ